MPNFNRSDRRVPPTEQSIHHILLVEDSAVQGLRMKQLLELEGLTVDWVEDGPEGLEQAQQHHYDLIVLDVELPTLNGYDTCRRLKLNPATADIPVVIFTQRDRPVDTLIGLDAGVVDYIPKDVFGEATLMSTIRQINARAG